MESADIARRAKELLAQLTGLKAHAITGLYRNGDGWHVSIDLVELKRIPETTDVLASYEVVLDDQGNMLRYRRTHRYYRGQVEAAERSA